VKFPQIKLSTLIALNLLAAGFLWLNVKDAVLGSNRYIAPLGWPNDAVLLYQEEWHKVRAERGFTPTWGEVMPAAMASNAVLLVTALALLYWVFERRRASRAPMHANTKWILAAVASILFALSIVKQSGSALDGAGYGLPFLAYIGDDTSAATPFVYAWDDADWIAERGWYVPNLIANVCVAAWVLLATYGVCQKIFLSKPVETPTALAASDSARGAH
jgi:hypothetical protein